MLACFVCAWQVKGVSQSSRTYAGLAVFMVVLCALFAGAWLAVVVASIHRARKNSWGGSSLSLSNIQGPTLALRASSSHGPGKVPTGSTRQDRVAQASSARRMRPLAGSSLPIQSESVREDSNGVPLECVTAALGEGMTRPVIGTGVAQSGSQAAPIATLMPAFNPLFTRVHESQASD